MSINLSNRIKFARINAGITQGELASKLGIAYPTMNKYERGHRIPDSVILERISRILGCDPGWLLSGETRAPATIPVSRIMSVAGTPVLKNIPDNFPDHVSEEITGYIAFPDTPGKAYAVVVNDDSMSPAIRNGDYIIFISDTDICNGEMIVMNNEWNEAVIRRYRRKKSEIYFSSDNPEYPSFVPDNEHKIIGKVIAVWRKVTV